MFESVPRTLEVAYLPPTFDNADEDIANPENIE